MATTYTVIASNVLSASAASVTFSSIPSTYTDLLLRVSATSDSSFSGGLDEGFVLTFNSNAANYSKTTLYGNSSTGLSVRDTATSSAILLFQATGLGATANTFGVSEIYIPSYKTSANKPFTSYGSGEHGGAAAVSFGANAALWNNTAAITSTIIAPQNGSNWRSGTSFYLYGIKNS